jgi:hypothetical protein
MKRVSPSIFLTVGFIVILFAGCFSAVGVQNGQDADKPAVPEALPFTMNVYIGPQSGQARVIVGPSITNIQNGLYNFIQLVVLDDESGAICAFDEIRRENSGEKEAELKIDSIPFGTKVHFLLLIGYWERNYNGDTAAGGVTTFAYNDSAKPVLLAAGYQSELIEGSGTITITMWPLVVDTTFRAGSTMLEGEIGTAAELLPELNWKVNWNLRRNTAGANGLDRLIEAQGMKYPKIPATDLLVNEKKFILDGVDISSQETTTTNNLELNLGTYSVSDIGTSHWANFYMEYTPYSIMDTESWAQFNAKSKFNLTDGVPVWIIRNGLNDSRQDENTRFDSGLGKTVGETRYNGNGAVVTLVKEEKGFTDTDPEDGIPDGAEDTNDDGYPDKPGTVDPHDFLIYNGKFVGPVSSANPAISFRTAGYQGNATVYYGITEIGGGYNAGNPLPYSEFTQFATPYAAGGPHTETVPIPDLEKDYDIWLMFIKDGKVSNRIAINTVLGNIDLNLIWGENKGALLIYNLSDSEPINSIRVRDSGGSEVPVDDITPKGASGITPIGPKSVQLIVLDAGSYTCEVGYSDGIQPQPKAITIEEKKFSSWFVSNAAFSSPIGILQVINLSGEFVTSVKTGTQELLLGPVVDTGLYSVALEAGEYPIKVKIESQADYFPEKTVPISVGTVTNLVVFNDRILVDPETVGEGNLWIVNRCPQDITTVERQLGSGYTSFLSESMPLSSGGYARTHLTSNTYNIRVTLADARVIIKPDVLITNDDPVFLIVQIGSDDQPEIIEIAPSGDSDGDGFPDWWEKEYFGPGAILDPNVPGRDGDADGDRLTNWDEFIRGTDPTDKDTDGDGLTDWEEINGKKDPSIIDANRPADFPSTFPATDPLKPDTDGDHYSDFLEIRERSDPNDPASKPGINIILPWGD